MTALAIIKAAESLAQSASFERLFIADYRGGVTCLYDTQLLGACLHVGLETGTQLVCSGA